MVFLKIHIGNSNIENYIFNFEYKFVNILHKSDLCITRAGASTLAELSVSNIPFLAIPLPSAKDDHQFENAIYYEKNGFGYLIEERDISKKLFQLIKQISENNNLLDQIKAKQRQHSDKTVYENIHAYTIHMCVLRP